MCGDIRTTEKGTVIMGRKILHIRIAVATTVGALVLSAAACGQELSTSAHESRELTVLIGPSGSDETNAVRGAVRDWAARNGRDVTVAVAADIPEQLAEGFANGDPADVFAVESELFTRYAEHGFLLPHGDDLENSRFSPVHAPFLALNDEFPCPPRKVRTISLVGDSLALTECWGIAARTPDPEAAQDLVRHLVITAGTHESPSGS